MKIISDVRARQIIDSRGNPTVEAEVIASATRGRAAVPSGASTGTLEALELRDGDANYYQGKSVCKAVDNIKGPIRDALIGMNVEDQRGIDEAMIKIDGTDTKSNLGANAMLAVSLATAHANAVAESKPLYRTIASDTEPLLPVPMINILNGGAHAENSVDLQEFMIVPVAANSIAEAVHMAATVFHNLRKALAQRKLNTAVGDEGGFAPNLSSNEEAVEIIIETIEASGYSAGKDVWLALDVASSEIYRDGVYHLDSEDRHYSSDEFADYLSAWAQKYPILSIEDGMAEDDWDGWKALTEKIGATTQLVGDDLFVTNVKLIQKGIDMGVANSVLIKPNQIGTLTETLEAIDLSQQADYSCVISHRSGETEDVSIADLAVATGVGQIKTGSLCRTDRVAKYNQLLRIEEDLGAEAKFDPAQVFGKLLAR